MSLLTQKVHKDSHFTVPSILIRPQGNFGRLQGKVAIVTGGASGFGESTVRLFAKHGAKVVIADVQDQRGTSLCQELLSISGNIVMYVHCDVTLDSDVQNLVNTTVSKYGSLDIMFNNAGISGDSTDNMILGSSIDNWKRVLEVNAFGSFLGAKHAARVMIPANSGVILFTSSVVSVIAGNMPHAYVMSKNAVVGLMKNLCVELGQYGIRVNCISPGGVATPLLVNAMGMEKELVESVCLSSPLKGVMPTADDVAKAALYLGSDEGKFVSGMNLVVDGGYSTTNPSYATTVKRCKMKDEKLMDKKNAPMSPALGLLLGARASDDVAMLNSGHRVKHGCLFVLSGKTNLEENEEDAMLKFCVPNNPPSDNQYFLITSMFSNELQSSGFSGDRCSSDNVCFSWVFPATFVSFSSSPSSFKSFTPISTLHPWLLPSPVILFNVLSGDLDLYSLRQPQFCFSGQIDGLQGKVAIVTGGASGFGESTVRLFAKHGAKVVIADVQDQQGASLCEELLSKSGNEVTYVHCDVTLDSDVENLVNTTVSKYGKLDIMFNNAGITGDTQSAILSSGVENFKRVFEVNALSAFLGAKHAARVMIPAKRGVVLFTASLVTVSAGDTSYAYTMSKHSVVGLTKNLCVELGRHGIRVNCISPWELPHR
ncbi:hypothetical protein OSB04_009608 [Centaurea solstitialis]|uniref:Uncharacterized protein n=1 Tax=Centaurea solstitialis TaxID=347529 RepID=A0AA38T7L7_9ASTR|nr:hypothetical protein OSB04_009608 [Centaurea solstitialis]